jgi:hypothetical protein
LENIRKDAIKSLNNVLKRRNIIEEGGASRSRVKKEQENIEARVQKMMRGKVAPSIVPTLV